VEERAETAGDPSAQGEPPGTLASQSSPRAPHPQQGEGIGLSIVKRLCEVLDASMEIESAAGTGTTFRVVLPCVYPR
jgi:signal transduction histidine kinase